MQDGLARTRRDSPRRDRGPRGSRGQTTRNSTRATFRDRVRGGGPRTRGATSAHRSGLGRDGRLPRPHRSSSTGSSQSGTVDCADRPRPRAQIYVVAHGSRVGGIALGRRRSPPQRADRPVYELGRAPAPGPRRAEDGSSRSSTRTCGRSYHPCAAPSRTCPTNLPLQTTSFDSDVKTTSSKIIASMNHTDWWRSRRIGGIRKDPRHPQSR